MGDTPPYNPLDKRNLGASIVEALLQKMPQPLAELNDFQGAGIYAIYFTGDSKLYSPLAKRNQRGKFAWPIYVGKAIPEGGRKGAATIGDYKGKALHKRLNEHARSIEQAGNLNLDDFQCRYLMVDDIWIPLAESLLISKLLPPWNCSLDGFGIHDPGGGRRKGQRSVWDVIHPGRPWAKLSAENAKSGKEISAELEAFIRETVNR